VSGHKGNFGTSQRDKDADQNQLPVKTRVVEISITNNSTDAKGYQLQLYHIDLMIGQNSCVGISLMSQILNILGSCITGEYITQLHNEFIA
jgi:hypothetical protein